MRVREFLRAGHTPTLVAAFLYFDVSFMVWVILGPLAPFIAEDLSLKASEKGLLVATPLLAGSMFRPLLGWLADRIGGRRAGLLGLGLTMLPLLLGWAYADSLPALLIAGVMLGIAGASFAVALPLAGRWYPPEYQGIAMGIAGAGNSGTLLATLFAPRIASIVGWQNTLLIAALPVLVVALTFALLARDNPGRPPAPKRADYARLLREPDTARFAFLYSLTFGGFVGLASFLTIFFHEEFYVSKIAAGDLTTLAVVAGSILRPVGGALADRIGGFKLLVCVLGSVCICFTAVGGSASAGVAFVLLMLSMALLGMGNGAVFQMVPQRFPQSVGIVTGLVGAAGGMGGFMLPFAFGFVKELSGDYRPGFIVCGAALLWGLITLLRAGEHWLMHWPPASARRAGIFSMRQLRPEAETPGE